MSEQLLELIKTRTLLLQEGALSPEIVLRDEIGGDMYFKVLLIPAADKSAAVTNLEIIDDFHATFTVGINPRSITRFENPIEIGSYNENRRLYINVVVQPVENDGEPHNVIVLFYTNSVGDGTK